jgi:hypothetical protein
MTTVADNQKMNPEWLMVPPPIYMGGLEPSILVISYINCALSVKGRLSVKVSQYCWADGFIIAIVNQLIKVKG